MTNFRYRPDIDGLRAVAILGVVAFHVGVPYITGGYAGVDVFFVVSGFLITRLLVGERARTGEISLSNFYERRARRLLPALSVVVFATLSIGYVLLPFANARYDLGRSAIFALFFVPNSFFRVYVGGYFHDAIELMPLAHTWSLGVEEQFYLFYPLALILFFRAMPPARRGCLKAAIACATAGSFLLSVALTANHATRAFYWTPSRAWELGVGVLIALCMVDDPDQRPALGTFLGLTGLAAIAVSFVTLSPASVFPGALALAPVLGTAMIVVAVPLTPRSLIARTLSSEPLVALGRVSYAWYLWHWPILVIARRWRLGDPDLRADLGWALVALGLAVLTTRFIERPFRQTSLELPASRTRFLRLAIATTVSLLALAVLVLSSDSVAPSRVAYLETQAPPFPCLAGAWTGALTFAKCETPPPNYPSAIVIWGDSHAAAWSPLAWSLGESEHVRVYQLVRNSCAPVIGLSIRRRGTDAAACVPFNDAADAWLRSAVARNGVRGVILAARWSHYIQGGVDSRHLSALADSRDATPIWSPDSARAGLERTLQFADSVGLRVLIMLSAPEFRYPLAECVAIRAVSRCGVSRAEVDAYRDPSADLIRSVARGHQSVRVVDPVGFFCDSLYCPAEVHGLLPTRDANHVTASVAREFAPFMHDDFVWLLQRH